jgi:hypothetical protein
MLPDLRFAIGAVLASALLIVTAFGLAATVRIAHHRTEGPLEAPRILAYSDPMDWGPRPDALRRLDDLRVNDALLERLAAIPADRTPTAAPEPASESVVVALPVEAVAPASVLPEAPNAALSAATPAAVMETRVAAAPAQVVADVAPDAAAEIPPAQIPEATPAETQRAVPDRMTVALATIDIAAKADAGFAALLQAAVRPPAKKAAPAAKKKVAKRRRAQRTVVREPTARTGYPVTSTNSFGNNGFSGNGFGKNSFDTSKYFGDN